MRHRIDEIEAIFAAAGCVGALCVQDAEGQQEIAIAADQPVVAASVIKVLVAVEVERQIAAGRLDPLQRVRLPSQALALRQAKERLRHKRSVIRTCFFQAGYHV